MSDNTGKPDLSALKESLTPQRDLWPGIEARLNADRPKAFASDGKLSHQPALRFAAMAASLILGLSIGMTVLSPQYREPQWVSSAQRQYQTVRYQVIADLNKTAIDPEVRDQIKRNLDDIDRSVEQIINLLKKAPADPELSIRLQDISRQRYEFLEAIDALMREESPSFSSREL